MKKISSFMYYYFQPKRFIITIPFVYSFFKKKNPIMEVEMNGQMVKIPFNHMGLRYQREYENYDRQLGKICKVIFDRIGQINVVDIGANIGDTLVNIGLGGGYLAIEGEKAFFPLLKENTRNYNVYYENVYLSDDEKSGYKNIITNGTGKLVEDNNNEVDIITLDKLMRTKYNDFKADIIKIDTDGFDFKVIRGAGNYIANTKPLLFFEWSKEDLNIQGENELSIFPKLEAMGYRDLLLFDNFGNKMLLTTTDNTKVLEYMANYTVNKDKLIHYYDILAIHKDSLFSCEDFEYL